MAQELNILGKRGVPRKDGFDKASGKGIYTRDIDLPGMLYARILTSPYPNSRIKSMDTSKAEVLPGVRAIIRYDDPEIEGKEALRAEPLPFGGASCLLLGDRAHYEGETLGCVVAADSVDIAEEALRLIDVDWEELPFVLDEEEALKPGAPVVDESGQTTLGTIPGAESEKGPVEQAGSSNKVNVGFVSLTPSIEKGDVEKGFKEADKIIEFKGRRTFNLAAGAEPVSSVARWNGDHLEVWLHTQTPKDMATEMATFFNLPKNKVVIHCPYQGCMWGAWNWCQSQYSSVPRLAGILARRTDRPVKVLYDRRDESNIGNMDAGYFYFKVGAKKDGTITAVEIDTVFGNDGLGPWEHLTENTKIKNISCRSTAALVNKGHVAPVRCEQSADCFALNLVFGHVSAELGLDPIEVALKNDGYDGEAMADLADFKREHGFPDRDSLKECIEEGKKVMDWDNKWHAAGTKKLPNGKLHGLGFIWGHEWGDQRGGSASGLYVQSDGSVHVMTCQSDIGLNNRSAYCQVVAEAMGVRYEDVEIKHKGQEDVGFWAMDPGGSHAFVDTAISLKKAGETAKERLLKEVTEPSEAAGLWPTINAWPIVYVHPPFFPGKKPEELDMKDSVIFEKANPENKKTLREVIEKLYFIGPSYNGTNTLFVAEWDSVAEKIARMLGWEKGKGFPQGAPEAPPRFVRQAHFMEVEVDPETGEVEVTKAANVNDVGQAASPEACEGQQYGGTYMGVGRALTEEAIYDEATGVMLNGNLLDYKYATIRDCGPIDAILVESKLGYGPWGSAGIGEDIGTHVPALIGLAVQNAIGVWIDDYPLTPDKVLKALGKAWEV
ncbi:xanthine dehydrogenase family protein molybdopterin-binding subunit [Chloroflexota bacterium]